MPYLCDETGFRQINMLRNCHPQRANKQLNKSYFRILSCKSTISSRRNNPYLLMSRSSRLVSIPTLSFRAVDCESVSSTETLSLCFLVMFNVWSASRKSRQTSVTTEDDDILAAIIFPNLSASSISMRYLRSSLRLG